jgi:exopolysaccharide biosynthesis polyprenyl glycosylphosphotransferase
VIGERWYRSIVTDRPIPLSDGTIIRSDVRERYRRLSAWIASTDGLSIVAAMLIAYVVRFGVQPVARDFTLVIASAPIAFVAIFSAFGLYSVQLISPAEEFRRIVAAIGTIVAAISLFGFWSGIPYSREWLGLTWVLTLLLCLAARKRWHQVIARKRVDGTLAYRTLVVGANDEARKALNAFRAPALGFRPVGVLTTERDIDHVAHAPGQPLIEISTESFGNVEALRQVIRELGVDCVFVASSAVTPEEMAQIAKASRLEGVEARLSLNLPHILPTRLTVQPLDHLTIISLKSARLSGGQAAAKRALDILGAAVGVLIMVPVSIGIGLAIKISSGGPILFRQVRVGKQGHPFTLLKFRTMIPGAEGMLIDLRDRNEADGPLFKIREDPRVTSVGRWLRKWSLDELPQLVNVLKGEMSLVGPRPPLQAEVESYEDWQHGRLEVAPGITGLWQVGGRIELSFDDAVRRDIFYIENWSLSYDLFILAKTIPAILLHRGAC